jgi:hypothetical protein
MTPETKFINQSRKKAQAFLCSSDEKFIVPIANTLKIEETSPTAGLKNVEIFDIPTAKHTISWVIDLEKENQVYSSPAGFKKAEKALIILDNKRLHCFMFELKSKNIDLHQVQQKFENTAERISLLLSIFNFDNPDFNDITFYFKGILCYNDDKISNPITKELKEKKIYKVFKGEDPLKRMSFYNGILGNYKMDIDFFKNPNSSAGFRIPFNQIYAKTINNTDLQLPLA